MGRLLVHDGKRSRMSSSGWLLLAFAQPTRRWAWGKGASRGCHVLFDERPCSSRFVRRTALQQSGKWRLGGPATVSLVLPSSLTLRPPRRAFRRRHHGREGILSVQTGSAAGQDASMFPMLGPNRPDARPSVRRHAPFGGRMAGHYIHIELKLGGLLASPLATQQSKQMLG